MQITIAAMDNDYLMFINVPYTDSNLYLFIVKLYTCVLLVPYMQDGYNVLMWSVQVLMEIYTLFN